MLSTRPSEVLLLGTGPSPVPKQILEAMSMHAIGHMDTEFLDIIHQTTDLLRSTFNTKNEITLPISGTGSAGMETSFVNFLEQGDKV